MITPNETNQSQLEALLSEYLEDQRTDEEATGYRGQDRGMHLPSLLCSGTHDCTMCSSPHPPIPLIWPKLKLQPINLLNVPKGYTAEELDRDNPYNQWMYQDGY
jgi:hypothetical protein